MGKTFDKDKYLEKLKKHKVPQNVILALKRYSPKI